MSFFLKAILFLLVASFQANASQLTLDADFAQGSGAGEVFSHSRTLSYSHTLFPDSYWRPALEIRQSLAVAEKADTESAFTRDIEFWGIGPGIVFSVPLNQVWKLENKWSAYLGRSKIDSTLDKSDLSTNWQSNGNSSWSTEWSFSAVKKTKTNLFIAFGIIARQTRIEKQDSKVTGDSEQTEGQSLSLTNSGSINRETQRSEAIRYNEMGAKMSFGFAF